MANNTFHPSWWSPRRNRRRYTRGRPHGHTLDMVGCDPSMRAERFGSKKQMTLIAIARHAAWLLTVAIRQSTADGLPTQRLSQEVDLAGAGWMDCEGEMLRDTPRFRSVLRVVLLRYLFTSTARTKAQIFLIHNTIVDAPPREGGQLTADERRFGFLSAPKAEC